MAAEIGPAEIARALLLRYFDKVLNAKDVGEMDRIFAPDVVYHSAGSPAIQGLPALKQWVADYLAAVPDYHATFEDTIAEPGKAVLRWSCTGTQRGRLLGLEPTGKRFAFSGITVFHVRDGRVVEGWIERDALGLAGQLGGK